jgi:hypothetical protein
MTDRSDDLKNLLHPASAFGHPADVLSDPDLTVNEKRAILASWASDDCAVEAATGLRASRKGPPVRFDDIMDALRTLDKEVNGSKYRRVLRRNLILGKNASGRTGSGTMIQ